MKNSHLKRFIWCFLMALKTKEPISFINRFTNHYWSHIMWFFEWESNVWFNSPKFLVWKSDKMLIHEGTRYEIFYSQTILTYRCHELVWHMSQSDTYFQMSQIIMVLFTDASSLKTSKYERPTYISELSNYSHSNRRYQMSEELN